MLGIPAAAKPTEDYLNICHQDSPRTCSMSQGGVRHASSVLPEQFGFLIHAAHSSNRESGKRGIISKGNAMRITLSNRSLLLTLMILVVPVASSAQIILSIGIAPPPLPVYEQPLCPEEGYIWTPGYWAYADDGYFWVPGTWVLVPEPGFLWTPAYWGWGDSVFVFHEGYWGPHVGFYGGINYGFGYVGEGYQGGYWNNGAFFYNRSVNNVTNVTNVYNKTVIVNNVTVNDVSYNGGEGGVAARPTAEEETAQHERHVPPTSVQTQHIQAASTNRQLYESVNHGKPAIAATAKPTQFSGPGIVAARAAAPSYRPSTARAAAPAGANNAVSRPVTAVHPKDLPPVARPAPNTGIPQQDKKYQQQQEKLSASQEQERQKLQQKQEQDHQRLAQGKADEASKQQLEQKHQQQTQQLAQKHAMQQQKVQPKQQPSERKPAKP
jgi:WXXGXW repeat (2 copies)